MNKPPYSCDSAPKLGLVTNSIKEFNDAGKEHSEKNIRALFENLRQEGSISKDSIYYGKRIFGYHEAGAVIQSMGTLLSGKPGSRGKPRSQRDRSVSIRR